MLDELGSWGLAQGSIAEIIQKTFYHQGQGPVYFILLSKWSDIFGTSHFALRLPSLIFILMSQIILYRAFKIISDKNFALLSVIITTLSPYLGYYSFLARPYGLANLLLCVLFLISVSFGKRQKYYLIPLAIIICVLLFFTHYLYLIAVPFTIMAVSISNDHENKLQSTTKWITSIGIISTILLLPFFKILLAKTGSMAEISFTPLPSIINLLGSFFFSSSFGVSAIIAALIYLTIGLKVSESKNKDLLIYSGASCLLCYLSLYCLSHIFSGSLFLIRYFSISFIFSSLATTALADNLIEHKKIIVTATLLLCTIQTFFLISQRGYAEGRAWQEVAENLEQTECELFASTGFIELQNPEKITDPHYRDFLIAPVKYYYKKQVNLLPLSLSNETTKKYFEQNILNNIKNKSCVTLLLNNYKFETESGTLVPIADQIKQELNSIGYTANLKTRPINHPYLLVTATKK